MELRARMRIAACVAALGLSAVSATLLVACGGTAGSSSAPSSPVPVVYTAADDGATVEASVGEQFTVTLEENPTTGYSWDMIAGPGLTQVGDKFVAPSPSPSPLMGAGGTHLWVFRADEAGTLTLTGRYVRPWEEDGKSAADFSLTIVSID
ncbi:MAG: protease inhibitor I42 family protein [Actinobacteria bacterium]|nr:protease inhibitor I42 family protein [Actinomycetota bacterium]